MNQAIEVAEKLNRKVCFVGRSIIKAKQLAQKLGYLHIKAGTEIHIDKLPVWGIERGFNNVICID